MFVLQILDDPTGNSFVENPFAPAKDTDLDVLHYVRTQKQDIDLGCVVLVYYTFDCRGHVNMQFQLL